MAAAVQGADRRGDRGGEKVLALKPQTYMNDSGRSIRAALDWYGLQAVQMLVLVDDMDLPLGRLRLRVSGGAGGHNGLRSTIAHLGGQDFPRLRIGIGHPRDTSEAGREVVDYVLHAPRMEEQRAIDEAMVRALDVWPQIVTGKMEEAMLKLHTKA